MWKRGEGVVWGFKEDKKYNTFIFIIFIIAIPTNNFLELHFTTIRVVQFS